MKRQNIGGEKSVNRFDKGVCDAWSIDTTRQCESSFFQLSHLLYNDWICWFGNAVIFYGFRLFADRKV